MKIEIKTMKERSKVEKCLRHLDATIDLFGNIINSVESIEEKSLYWAVIEFTTRKGKPIYQKYSFSSMGEREIFINKIIETYKEEM